MNEMLKNYNYSKQYILVEDNSNVILKNLKENPKIIDIEDYQWKIVTSVTSKKFQDKTYDLIQFDDQQVGWIELKSSIPIYRFASKTFKLIEDNYYSNDINSKLEFEKDFFSAFQGKLLTVKSEIEYQGERYFGVFIKEKFQGFHHTSYLEQSVEINKNIDNKALKDNNELFKVSDLSGIIDEEIDINKLKVISVFPINKIVRIQVNENEMYWTSLENFRKIDEFILVKEPNIEKNIEDKIIEDILYSVEIERNKTKKIVKSVLSAKELLKIGKGEVRFQEFTNEDEVKNLKSSLKLAEQRLNSQKDYNERLTAQRDKYKARMQLVEDKLKKLDRKYKELKNK